MSDKVKLTDELLDDLFEALAFSLKPVVSDQEVVAAIRALRDRAKAVVERYTDHSGICEEDGCEVCPAVKLLMEVLP